MKLGLAIHELHRAENSLAADLVAVADRHKVDHEIHHVGRDLARWSQEHARELTDLGRRYGLHMSERTASGSRILAGLRGKVSELLGRRPEPTLLLLTDLRHLHRVAAGVSLDWELLAQGAKAVNDRELVALTERCHPQTLRQMHWTNTMLKNLSPQFLAS